MKELVDGDKFEKMIGDLSSQEIGGVPYVSCVHITNSISDCTLSPAELGGDSWVLEELKKKLQRHLYHYTNKERIQEKGLRPGLSIVLEHIQGLESQAPVSELAGDSWMIGELRKRLFNNPWKIDEYARSIVLTELNVLKSEAPAKPAPSNEDRRKAEAWDTLSGIKAKTKDKEPFVKEVKEMMQAIWDLQGELLAESDLQDYL